MTGTKPNNDEETAFSSKEIAQAIADIADQKGTEERLRAIGSQSPAHHEQVIIALIAALEHPNTSIVSKAAYFLTSIFGPEERAVEPSSSSLPSPTQLFSESQRTRSQNPVIRVRSNPSLPFCPIPIDL